jgi:HAE1 family hydrophobic/amphiphilic exporter-1
MKEITAPVIAVALVLAAVFVPVGFIPGITGRLYQQFAITIAISVVLSAFVALSLTPALCTLLLKPTEKTDDGQPAPAKGVGRLFAAFNRWFERTAGAYTNGVRRAIGITPVVLLVLVGVYGATFLLFRNKPTGFIPSEDQGLAFVSVELPPGASSVRTKAVMTRMGDIMQTRFPAIQNYAGIGGLNAINFSYNSSSGTFFVQLKPWDEREADSLKLDAVIGSLQQAFAAIPEARVVVVAPPAIPGLGNSGGFNFQLEQRQNAGDIKAFEAVVNKFAAAANQRPEIAAAYTFFSAQTPATRLPSTASRPTAWACRSRACSAPCPRCWAAPTSTISPSTAATFASWPRPTPAFGPTSGRWGTTTCATRPGRTSPSMPSSARRWWKMPP